MRPKGKKLKGRRRKKTNVLQQRKPRLTRKLLPRLNARRKKN